MMQDIALLVRTISLRLGYSPMPLPRTRLQLLLTILAAAGIYLVGNRSVPLWDRDEPRYAQTSRQMLQSGDWIVPRLLEKPRERKPVFIYWCQAGSMAVFGDNVFAARFPSVVFVTITLGVFGFALWRTIGPRRAFWTTFIFATSVLTIAAAKMAITDGVLILFVTTAQLCFYAIWRGSGTWLDFTMLGFAMGFGILTKGPVVPGILIVTAIALFFLSWYSGPESHGDDAPRKDGVTRAALKWFFALTIAATIVTPWLIAIERQLPGYTIRTLKSEVVNRVTDPQEGHSGPPGFYLLTIWGTYFPWSLLLPAAIVSAWRHRRIPAIRFALAAVIGPWLMFELVQTKLVHYLLPVFPALAFLTADLLVRESRRRASELKSPGFARIVACWGIIVWLVSLAPWLILLTGLSVPTGALCALITLALVAGAYAYEVFVYFRAKCPLDAAAVMGIGMMLIVAIFYGLFLPNAPFLQTSQRVAAILRERGATKFDDAIMIDYQELSLPFYQGGTIRPERRRAYLDETQPDDWAKWIVLTPRVLDATSPARRAQIEIIATVRGWWYARGGKVVDVLIARRKPASHE